MTQEVDGGAPEADGRRIGISLSGGGVRSAAFCFGALQALQGELGLVHGDPLAPGQGRHADYLAAVSGGSYIAAATMMSVAGPLGDEDAAWDERWRSGPAQNALTPGSSESDFLRVHARYLTEGSTVALVLRLLGLVGVSLVATLASAVTLGWLSRQVWDLWGGPPWLHPALFLLVLAIGIGVWRVLDREFRKRIVTGAEVGEVEIMFRDAAAVGGYLVVGTAVALLYVEYGGRLADTLGATRDSLLSWLVGLGVGSTAVLGPALLALVRAQLAPSKRTTPKRSAVLGAGRRVLIAVVETALLLCVPVTVAAAFVGGWTQGGWPVLAAAVVLAAVTMVAVVAGDRALSPHAFYRFRLSQAFSMVRQNLAVQPAWVAVSTARTRLRRRQPLLSSLALPYLPELLICASVNITERGVTAAGSYARPIVFGAENVLIAGEPGGGVKTTQYEEMLQRDQRWGRHSFDGTIMSYVALTGAAVSPSMGKYTKSWLRAVMTLLNLRLGAWVPNPATPEIADLVTRDQPLPRRNRCPGALLWLREFRGRHYVRARHIYVSDGGHYENLGVVELIRRGCTEVWAIDASDDDRGTWHALSESLNLISSELGCEVTGDFEAFSALDDAADPGQRFIRRTHLDVRVTGIADQFLPYEAVIHVVKLGISPETNPVVLQLAAKYRRFPYDSTVNQLYTAERFDLYRALGHDSTRWAIAQSRDSAHA